MCFFLSRLDGADKNDIYMYDLNNNNVNKLNGELSNKFVTLAEENVSNGSFRHSDTLDPTIFDAMLQQLRR